MRKTIVTRSLAGILSTCLPTMAHAGDIVDDRCDQSIEDPAPDTDCPAINDLLDLQLDELLAQEVTSLAKKSRPIGQTPAAISVITQEDIRRSSARTVPDLLRMVPGMEVAEIQSSSTAVSARGFYSPFPTTLLVMVDGASIYRTSISGMFWDQALVPLQDIERIEVIRGPSGTIWGSNALSGVVNIITKQSIDTQGLRANASVGTFDTRVEVGYGRLLADNLAVRTYADYRQTDGLDIQTGQTPNSAWRGGLAGVRLDYAPSARDSVVALAEYSRGAFQERQFVPSFAGLEPTLAIESSDNDFSSTHALLRWNRRASDGLDHSLQAYYNQLTRSEFGATVDRTLFDISGDLHWRVNPRHEISLGISGRVEVNRLTNSPAIVLPSESQTDHLATAYFQDDINIVPDRLELSLGSKLEVNNYTGVEIQPSARLLYRPDTNLSLWAAVTRGVKTPILLQRSIVSTIPDRRTLPEFPTPVISLARFYGSENAKSEKVVSLEAGVRGSLSRSWNFDLAAHHSRFSRLASAYPFNQEVIFGPFSPNPVASVLEWQLANQGTGRSSGVEALVDGELTPWWHLEMSYSFLHLATDHPAGTVGLSEAGPSSPHQVRLVSTIRPVANVSITSSLHFMSRSKDEVRPAYWDADLRATWQVTPQIDISVIGSNLFDARRLEYVQTRLPIEQVYVPRSVLAETRFRF